MYPSKVIFKACMEVLFYRTVDCQNIVPVTPISISKAELYTLQLKFLKMYCPRTVHCKQPRLQLVLREQYIQWMTAVPLIIHSSVLLKKTCNPMKTPKIRKPQKTSFPWVPRACCLQKNLGDLKNLKMLYQPKLSMTISCNSQVRKEDFQDQKALNKICLN